MKTLVLLSALVGLSVAAPAPQAQFQGFESFQPVDFNAEISARSNLGVSNPVIVKKKTGYHVYRDSTEERANSDPRENCGKQVRVKLCDDIAAKSSDLRRSTKNEDFATHTDDVENSIKLAKEAVESLQRDLKTIEHGTSGKSAQWKHGEPDKDLHKDIEAARLALEHAQKNFGNQESMSMRAATLTEGKTLQEMVQWKEAMKNIQRNVEIARNIEDSFKSAEPHSSLANAEAFDTTKLMRSHENEADFHKKSTSSAATTRKSFEEKTNKQSMAVKSQHHHHQHHIVSEKKAEEHFEQDMKSAASETVSSKHQHIDQTHHNSKATQGKLADVSVNLKSPLALKADADIKLDKGNGIQLDASLRSTQSENIMSASDKSMDTKHSDSAHKIIMNKEISSRTSENAQHSFAMHKDESSAHMKKSFESHNFGESAHKTMHQGKSVTKELETNIADKTLNQEKSAWSETEHKDMLMKSAEQNLAINTNVNHEEEKTNAKLSMKSAEHLEHKNIKENSEMLVKNSASSQQTNKKMADDVEIVNDVNINGPFNFQLNNGDNVNVDKSQQFKSALPLKGSEKELARVAYGNHGHHEHGHHEHGYHEHGHHIGYQGGQGYGHHGHGHHGHGYHGKSVELDNAMHPSMQLETKEFSEKSAMENLFQWKHHHDAARSSYGGVGPYGGGVSYGAAGGSGAVGVFPHAKIGGCGVPLLLSCSPSVVSGSLAKSHGYAAPAIPAYRSEDELKIKEKRDIIKSKETPIKKAKDVVKSTKPKDLEKKL